MAMLVYQRVNQLHHQAFLFVTMMLILSMILPSPWPHGPMASSGAEASYVGRHRTVISQ